MVVSAITKRFLLCLDKLVEEGKVRSRRHFALSIGYHAQGISEMIGNRRDVPLDLIEKSVLTFHFNPHFLFTGTGNQFSGSLPDDGLRLRSLSVVIDQKGDERIVHVPFPAQAGYGKLLDDPTYMQDLPSYQLPDPQFRSGSYRSFEIAGTSMEPTFRPNDIVIAAFIEPRYWEQAIKNHQLYIIVTHQEVIIKRIVNRIKADKIVDCISDNEEFNMYSIPADEILEVWKVRMKITSHFEQPSSQVNSISQQLKAQQKMLENLQHHFTKTLAE
ncbi:MAG TPA: S24 family peptidase [Saprospiraceae bacterium]|nr:S24 family peptidase [Saprospiraceae bacterium]